MIAALPFHKSSSKVGESKSKDWSANLVIIAVSTNYIVLAAVKRNDINPSGKAISCEWTERRVDPSTCLNPSPPMLGTVNQNITTVNHHVM